MALFRRSGGVGVGIDLGTSNIVVYQSGKGVVYDEPSCVSVRTLPRGGVEVIGCATGIGGVVMIGWATGIGGVAMIGLPTGRGIAAG